MVQFTVDLPWLIRSSKYSPMTGPEKNQGSWVSEICGASGPDIHGGHYLTNPMLPAQPLHYRTEIITDWNHRLNPQNG